MNNETLRNGCAARGKEYIAYAIRSRASISRVKCLNALFLVSISFSNNV